MEKDAESVKQATDRTVRAQAQALLRSAKRVFIAYTSSDLTTVRNLRRRIIRMRRPAAGETVFMASDSLPVGEAADPSRIHGELQRADLFVLACGSLTPNSPWVMKEIQEALLQRAEGRTQILPVILKAGLTLPPGIDFAIHAIHFTTLFPAIRRIRIAIGSALIALTAAAVVLGTLAVQRARERDLVSLQGKLESADLQVTGAIDLVRRDWLLTQRAEALRLHAADEVRTIDQKLSRYASPKLRRTWLPADPRRLFLVVDPGGMVIWLGYEHRVEKRAAIDGRLLAEINLQSFAVVPYEPLPILTAKGSPRQAKPTRRSPARLVLLRTDQRVRGILAEVEYPDSFAEPSTKDAYARAGYSSQGSEREILLLTHDSAAIQAVGLSVELTAENDATGELGAYDKEVSRNERIDSTLSEATPAHRSRIIGDWRTEDKVRRIAVDPRSGAGVFHALRDRGARDNHTGAFSFEGWQDSWVVQLRPDGRIVSLSPESKVFPAGLRMAWPDGNGQNPFVARAPNYLPAALGPRKAVLGYDLKWSAAAPGGNAPRINGLWFSDDGITLRLHLEDGSVATASSGGNGAIRRFLRPTAVRAIDLSSDGAIVFILNADGRIDTWDLRAFGEDGWIAPQVSTSRAPLGQGTLSSSSKRSD